MRLDQPDGIFNDLSFRLNYLRQPGQVIDDQGPYHQDFDISDTGLILPDMRPKLTLLSSPQNLRFEDFSVSIISKIPLAPKTRASYESVLRCHVMGKLGDKTVQSITYDDILGLSKDLNPQIRVKFIAVLRTIFREAILQGIIKVSPLAGKRTPMPIVPRRRFLTLQELEELDFGKYKTQIQFLGLHGLRWGEAVVLTNDDIRGDLVYINRSIHGSTKSRAGVRVVPLVSEFKVFPKSPKTLRTVLKAHGVTIHSLRHTYAYILKVQGIHVTTAQRLLGHSDPKITMAIYTEVLDDEIEAAGQILRTNLKAVPKSAN